MASLSEVSASNPLALRPVIDYRHHLRSNSDMQQRLDDDMVALLTAQKREVEDEIVSDRTIIFEEDYKWWKKYGVNCTLSEIADAFDPSVGRNGLRGSYMGGTGRRAAYGGIAFVPSMLGASFEDLIARLDRRHGVLRQHAYRLQNEAIRRTMAYWDRRHELSVPPFVADPKVDVEAFVAHTSRLFGLRTSISASFSEVRSIDDEVPLMLLRMKQNRELVRRLETLQDRKLLAPIYAKQDKVHELAVLIAKVRRKTSQIFV